MTNTVTVNQSDFIFFIVLMFAQLFTLMYFIIKNSQLRDALDVKHKWAIKRLTRLNQKYQRLKEQKVLTTN